MGPRIQLGLQKTFHSPHGAPAHVQPRAPARRRPRRRASAASRSRPVNTTTLPPGVTNALNVSGSSMTANSHCRFCRVHAGTIKSTLDTHRRSEKCVLQLLQILAAIDILPSMRCAAPCADGKVQRDDSQPWARRTRVLQGWGESACLHVVLAPAAQWPSPATAAMRSPTRCTAVTDGCHCGSSFPAASASAFTCAVVALHRRMYVWSVLWLRHSSIEAEGPSHFAKRN